MKNLALGLHNLLLHAIHDHRKADREHRLPRRFELPYEVFDDFRLNLDFSYMVMPMDGDSPHVIRWNGVEVHGVPMGHRPKMINADNVVEYL